MDNFMYGNPTKIVFGKGQEENVGALCAELGSHVLVIHYGGTFLQDIGLYDKMMASFKAAGIAVTELGGVVSNPQLDLVYEGVNLCKKNGIDCLLAVGGGSVIDTAKSIAAGMSEEGDIWDYFTGAQKSDYKKALPIGVILTIAASGSESSPAAVVSKGHEKLMISSPNLIPKFAVLNPEYTYGLPAYQTAAGGTDIISHLLERYFTQEKHVDLTDRLLEGAIKTMMYILPRILKDPKNYDYRAEMMWCGTIAHNGILGCGRIEDWASHNIEHELSGAYNITHGAGMAVIFPAWMKYTNHCNPARFVQFATRVMGVDIAFDNEEEIILEGIARFEQFLVSVGMPIRMSDAGIDGGKIREMAERSMLGGQTMGNFMKLSADDAEKILRLAL